MKRFYSPLLLIIALAFGAFQAQANRVIVKGQIKSANGNAVVNHRVTIANDTLVGVASCYLVHQKFTDAQGYYADTLECNTAIVKLRISTENCDGTILLKDPQVPPSGVVEAPFTLCVPLPTNCVAYYIANKQGNTLGFEFNSSSSQGTNPNDPIIRRRWRFGDGDTLGGNLVNVAHTYQQRGSYNACLTIWTAAGCENNICKTIVVGDTIPAAVCAANFSYLKQPTSNTVVFNDSTSHGSNSLDHILQKKWDFGDGLIIVGNFVSAPFNHYYVRQGVYQACLTIWTASGCQNTICKTIVIDSIPPTVHCESKFTFASLPVVSPNPGFPVSFNSAPSAAQPGDSIRERIWKFGDGTTGNTFDPTHVYAAAGSYNVCLIIRTVQGCSDTACLMVNIPPTQAVCHARFTYAPVPNSNVPGFSVKFNSSMSEASAGDSIRERVWTFGDGTTLTGNIDPTHIYAHDGLYTVCLTIKTIKGCTSQECKQVVVTQNASQCAPQFTFEKLGPKKVRFNSGMSYIAPNDSIVERTWQFGDGTTLGGNVIGTVKEYQNLGIYTVCLKIKTARGCTNTFCNTVRLQDSVNTPVNNEPIRILSLYPTPATVQLTTVVWSLHNNINAELAIFDIYGVKKWGMNKVLLQGNNVTVIPTAGLLAGPYYFRVTTMYGTQSRMFYKL